MSNPVRVSKSRRFALLAALAATACAPEGEPPTDVVSRAAGAPVCEPVDLDPRLAIFETNVEVLAPFTMRSILRHAAQNAGLDPTPVATYRRIIDTYATAEQGVFPGGQHCDDELPHPAFTDPGQPCGLLGCDQRFFCAAHGEQCFACNAEGTICVDAGLPSGTHEVCAFDGTGEICTFEDGSISGCAPVTGEECDAAGCHPLGCDAAFMCDPSFQLCIVCSAELDECEITQGVADEPVELVCNFVDLCELDVATGTVSGCEPDPICEEAQCGSLGCSPQFLCMVDGPFCFVCSGDGQLCEVPEEMPSPAQACNFDTGELCTFENGSITCGPDTEGICFGGGGGDTGGFDSGGFIGDGEVTTNASFGSVSIGSVDEGGFSGGETGVFADTGGGGSEGGDPTFGPETTFGGATSFGESDGGGDFGDTGDDFGDGGDGPGFGAIDGYPLECPRAEAQQIDDVDAWFPIAISNRFDLAPADGAHCGQQRIVLANNTQNRMFMIFEAQVPNPHPECGLDACRPVAEFWARMNEITDPKKRKRELVRAFLKGHPDLQAHGFGPFVNAENFSFGTGQVRTNNFDQFPWTLREFKLVEHAPSHKVRAVQVPVADSPVGDHFNDALDTPLGPECRESFLVAMEGLLTNEPDAMTFAIAPECRAAESRDDFVSDLGLQLALGTGAFEAEIEARLAELGSPLTAADIAARARFAGACIGCHEQSNGADLGAGVSAPFSAGFTHTAEFATEPCLDGQQCFSISDALQTSFLPHRKQVLESFLATTPCDAPACDGPPYGSPLGPADLPQLIRPDGDVDIDAMLLLERRVRTRGAPMTIGGRPVTATH